VSIYCRHPLLFHAVSLILAESQNETANMKFFPMFLRMADRDVIIVGGGETAAQKARLVLKTEARITFVAPDLEPELQALVNEGRAVHDTGAITPETFRGTALTFIGTDCPGMDAALHALAQEAHALVNVVDQPHLCEANTPSLVDRDPLVVAIGTEGAAPVLARQIKTHLEQVLEPRLGDLVALGGRLRGATAQGVAQDKRRAFWRWVYADKPRELFKRGAEREAAELIKAAIENGCAPDDRGQGSLCLVPVGALAPDLMTLRAVQRMQEADLIMCSDEKFAPLLELARRDAERVIVGQDFGTQDWDIDKQSDAAVKAQGEGRRVVWLIAKEALASARSRMPNSSEEVPCAS
jgi:uroporphyrin-III C-methyltransferase/precorrin-2 dehydrogenase/sirohydrochlorin ferrochelatase